MCDSSTGCDGLDGIISGWMKGGLDGREGQVTPGAHQKKTE